MKQYKIIKFLKFAIAIQFGFTSRPAFANAPPQSVRVRNNNLKSVVLIMAPQANPTDYQAQLQNSKNFRSFVDVQIERIINNESQEEEVFTLAEQIENEPQFVINRIEQLISKEPLTQVSLDFITDFSDKYHAKASKLVDRNYFLKLNCKNNLLTKKPISDSCKRLNLNISLLKKKWPEADRLLIESQPYFINEAGPEFISDMKYHWTLLSNSSKSISFYGTYDQLLLQNFKFENVVSGSSSDYSSNVDDLEINATGLIFFSKESILPVTQPIKNEGFLQWANNNRAWLIPVGLILVSAAALNSKNKKLVIEKSF